MNDHLYLVTEFHTNGSIVDLVEKLNPKSESRLRWDTISHDRVTKGLKNNICRLYLIDMLKALHYCHKVVKIIHRDIKPDNIMINHNNEAILIDFGVSGLLEDK